MLFLQKKFREYYKNADIELPKRFGRREFGFMFFDKAFVIRHVGFKTKYEFKKFVLEKIPSHVYYSSAYYKFPNAERMQEKNWLGADLIFDLDADHISGAEKLSFEEQLKRVKEEILKLLNNFLLSDFGFGEEDVKVVFSGGRGYHIHISDVRVLQLNSHERRNIIDYIGGVGIDWEKIFIKRAFKSKRYGNRQYLDYNLEIPLPEEHGWRGKISREILNFLKELKSINSEEAIRKLKEIEGIREKDAINILNGISKINLEKRHIEKDWTETGYGELPVGGWHYHSSPDSHKFKNVYMIDSIPIQNLFMRLGNLSKEKISINLGESGKEKEKGEKDEPVTSDTKRLIRLPYSLHGKTGLLVKPLKIDDLKEFSPLRDAIVFSDNPIKINIKKPIKITMKENFDLKEGITEVPEYLAVFLSGRNIGEVVEK